MKEKKILFKPKKELGQNFILDQNFLDKLLKKALVGKNSIVIEIGSGYGVFTNKIANETDCYKVIGLEKDKQLFDLLIKNNISNKICYLNNDVLEINWEDFCLNYCEEKQTVNIVGNLPFYISNYLIIELLLNSYLFDSFSFLVQKEVAQRWAAFPKDSQYSALSVFIKSFSSNIKIETFVPRTIFFPVPLVDGALINIKVKKHLFRWPIETKKEFYIFLKNCFLKPRKTLFNNLLRFMGYCKNKWIDFFGDNGLPLTARPSDVDGFKYWSIYAHINKKVELIWHKETED